MIKNDTTGTVLWNDFELANTPLSRMRGLMFRLRMTKPLLFEFPRVCRVEASVHMFFVFFPIDLIYLDENKRIVDLKENFKPFSINYTPRAPVKYLIEAPVHSISLLGLELGQKLSWP